MLLIIGDAETLDNRCADRAQLIHDDRVPLVAARRKAGRRRSLSISDLIANSCTGLPSSETNHPTRQIPLGGVPNSRVGAPQQVSPESRQLLRAAALV